MKIQVRQGVFETNSSSTHSLCIVDKSDYDKWKKGELYLQDSDEFITYDEAVAYIKKHEKEVDVNDKEAMEELFRENDIKTMDEFFDDECLESFEETYKTKSGDEIVAFGLYGRDG
jgi:uncharacterized beta-barrel protein YwiB (DUF1934 family)